MVSTLTLLFVTGGLLALPLVFPESRRRRQDQSDAFELPGSTRVLWWINLAYCRTVHHLELRTPCTIPKRGPAILISNHTCGIDHMLLQSTTERLLGFMVAQEYYNMRFINILCRIAGCISVKRDGRDLSAARVALKMLQQDRVLPIFPEGRINPVSGATLLEAKSGAAFLALKSRAPVIPAYIRGTPPTNEIPKAVFGGSWATVTYGPPVDLSDFADVATNNREALDQITIRLMGAIDALRVESLADWERNPNAPAPAPAPSPSPLTPTA